MYPTPEEVIEAYKVTGLSPASGSVFPDRHSGCAFGALALSGGLVRPLHCYNDTDMRNLGLIVLEKLEVGLDGPEMLGFAMGFDDGFREYNNLPRYSWGEAAPYLAGYEVGVEVKQWWQEQGTSREINESTVELEEALV